MRSVERYLLAWILGALSLGTLMLGSVIYLVTLDEMNDVYDADLRHVAEALGSYLHAEPGATPGNGRPLPTRTDVAEPAEIVTVLWTSGGRMIFSSDPRVGLPFLEREALTRTLVGNEAWFVYTDVSRNGVAQAAQRVHARHETAREAASKILPAMIGVSLLVALLLVFALRRGLKPLDEAAREIASRSGRTLSPIPASGLPAELTPLVHAFNGLMQRLTELRASQRRFLGDAAHELRSPVTALRLQLQLLQRSPDSASAQAAMQELALGVDRSQALVEKLLQVARSDPDAEPRSNERIDLAELARATVGALSLQAEQFGIDLGAKTMQPLDVAADRQDLGILLTNLIENALRYTPAGGVVDVEACLLDGVPALRVVDSGPGIAPDERERVFDRFYRGNDAHLLARQPGGSGLGLAIVRGIAERHGAAVSLHTPATGRGLEVRVVFSAWSNHSAGLAESASAG